MAPFFSVIIPAYNRQEFLDEAVASVLNQTYGDWELLVVDDASPAPLEVVHEPRVRLLRCDHNVGKSAAINAALDQAQGTVIAFLDDDDTWSRFRLENAWRAHRGGAEVVVCGSVTLDESTEQEGTHNAPFVPLHDDAGVRGELLGHMGATSVGADICPNFDETFRACEDLEWAIRLDNSSPLAARVLSNDFRWRKHSGVRHLNGIGARIQYALRLLEVHADYYDRYPGRRAFRLYRIGAMYLSTGRRRLALQWALRSVAVRRNRSAFGLVARSLVPPALAARLIARGQ